jgi:RND family efflux transporter MFP subunit
MSLGLAACGREKPAPPGRAAESAPARAVKTAAVERAAGESATLPAVVEARQRASLSTRVPATVVELPYREGEGVAQGAVVVRLDDRALRAALAAAETSLKSAEADLLRAERLQQKGAATPREHEEAATRAEGARAQREAARDALSYAVLRAPFAGRIAARPASVGDVVSPGMALVEIEGGGGLEVRATVDAEGAALLRPGMAVKALVDGQPEPLVATVRTVSPAGDPTTHRFEVKADLPRAAGLRSGLFARLALPSAPGSPQLNVPATAVFARGGLTGVFVVEGGSARLRFVALGSREGAAVEVRAGLAAGEKVVLDPEGLVDGALVVEGGR